MENIIDILIRVAAMLLIVGIGWLGRYLVKWLRTKLNDEQSAKLDLFVGELVAAAEQMCKNLDPDGSVRLDYVTGMLIEAGYEITDAVRALIEAKVYEVNLANKDGGVG